jgi:hypothetical protein
MKLKNYNEFLTESNSIHQGDFKVTSNMVKDGRFIEGKIPYEVTGDFHCNNNKLTSLEGGPSKVGESFYCYNNQLTSLEGCPSKVGESFYCSYNKLTSLEGGPL